jgi:hypothetical protein
MKELDAPAGVEADAGLEAELEKVRREVSESLRDSDRGIYKLAIGFVTLIFLALAVYAGIQTFSAERRVDQAIERVDQAIERMNSQFERLAADALRRPEFEILYQGESLGDSVALLPPVDRGRIDLTGFSVKNVGAGTGSVTSLKIFVTAEVEHGDAPWNSYFSWNVIHPSSRRAYPGSIEADGPPTNLSPTDETRVPIAAVRLKGKLEGGPITGLIEVHYGEASPASAHFRAELPERPAK